MYLRLQITLWACICYTLYCQNGLSEKKLESVRTFVNEFCHFTDIAQETGGNNVGVQTVAGNKCCKGCPTGKNCTHIKSENKFAGLTECLLPTPFEYSEKTRLNPYRFVVREPEGGCVNNTEASTNDTAPSCGPELNEFGSNLYPVYSYDQKISFKNKKCALCHGAKDLIYWEVYSSFRGDKVLKLQTLSNGFRVNGTADLFTWFSPPNVESMDYIHACQEVMSECIRAQSFEIPGSFNMTRDEIQHLCIHSPNFLILTSPFEGYKNIFCFICNIRHVMVYDKEYCESKLDPEYFTKTMYVSFTFLFKRDYIRNEIEQVTESARKIWACSKYFNRSMLYMDHEEAIREHIMLLLEGNKLLVKVTDQCREVMCPLLQTRLRDGRCDYPFDKFYIDKIVLMLNLTSDRFIDLSNTTSDDVKLIFSKHYPWPSNWKIIYVMVREDQTNNGGVEFLVSIGLYTTDSVNFWALRRLLSVCFSRPWIIDISGNDSLPLTQELHKHGVVRIQGTGIVSVQDERSFYSEVFFRMKKSSLLSQAETPRWNPLFSGIWDFYGGRLGEEMFVRKPMLCDQIQLEVDEYVYEGNEMPLFLTYENMFLYPDEYYVKSQGGKDAVVISVEDSRFSTLRHNNIAVLSGKETAFTIVWWASVCVVLLQSY